MTQTTAPRSLKEKQRQERQALILQAAEEVLMEKGYHETSIEEIASRVGIAKGTVYLHFASKEELVFALFEQDLEKFLQLVDSTIASELTALAKMEAISQVLYSGFFSKRFQLLYSLSNSADLRRMFVEKKGCMRETWERISALISTVLEEGKASGEFDTTIPTSVMVSAFFSLLSPKSYDRLMVEGQMPQEEVSRQIGRIYFKGIAAV
jgi:TetR/AcrR family transcriptional regulator, fatty acid metabolism regulator protein